MAAITTAAIAAVGVGASIYSSNKANKTAQKAQQSQEEILQRQQDLADEQWENYKLNYLPLEQQFIEKAKNYDSIANQEKAAANAGASSAARFASAREQLTRTPGLNPTSQQYLREAAKLGIAEAATGAAEENKAREGVERTGAAMLQDAASLGKGIAGNATSSLNAAASGIGNYANAATQRAGASASGLGQMVGGLYQSGAFNGITDMFKPAQTSQYSLATATPATTAVEGVGLSSGSQYGLSPGGGLGLQYSGSW